MLFDAIFGYGSLMSEDSAKRTMPSLQNYQCAKLYGYRRIFSLVSMSAIRNRGATFPHIAALAIKPDATMNAFVIGCLFDIPEDELEDYLSREARYRAIEIDVEIEAQEENKLASTTVKAWTVIEQTDEDYKARLVLENKSYESEVGQYYACQLWGRQDILPETKYLATCLEAATRLGQGQDYARNNFLQQGFLADGVTTIETYASTLVSRY
jgi:cation transport regulator ChaC